MGDRLPAAARGHVRVRAFTTRPDAGSFSPRDRTGEKPLFYRHSPGPLAFACELKGLLADPAAPRALDRVALEHYLAAGYVPGDQCLLHGFRKLPPAHALTYAVDSDALEVWRYWELPAPDPAGPAGAEELIPALETLLRESVQRQLVADVPVGVLLSGGLDSSLVTAFAAAASTRPVKTFTISFPGHGSYDESPHARLVAHHFGTDHAELEAEPASVELLPLLARQYDDPVGDFSMVPCRLVREHATVALGGDGGDELFGGYRWYNDAYRLAAWRRRLPQTLRSATAAFAARALPLGRYGRRFLLRLGQPGFSRADRLNLFDEWTRARLLRRRAPTGASPETGSPCRPDAEWSDLRAAQSWDFLTYLPEDILAKVDRASMLSSPEVRAPWLDRRIVEFAFRRVPDCLKATATQRKILLRLLGARVLPPSLDLRRKEGVPFPSRPGSEASGGTSSRGS